ncbi:MAG: metal ABC transporter permease [Pseudoclavibacter sp.]|nr:metal ABC transporter permease [Pseudoclavibacter sp.]
MSPVEFLQDHSYRTVLLGTCALGVVAGALGVFPYLRRQSLMSDVVAHASLPGALAAFLIAVVLFGADGRAMPALIAGATATGVLAVGAARLAARSGVRIDAAMAVSLTLFFGFGMLLLRHISDGPYPGKGGIHDYLFGNASVLTRADLVTSLAVGAAALLATAALWRPFAMRTFDPEHAVSAGVPGKLVDALMFLCVVVATVIGVKAVGIVLMVAFVVTPPAAARQWSRTLRGTVLLAAAIGGAGSAIGAYLSVALGGLPTGPVISLVLFAALLLSLLLAPGRSVVVRAAERMRMRRELASGRRGS